jgi:hypothetical protein
LQLGGGCFCSRGETKAPSLSASEILPLFCVGGEASAHELSLPLSLSLSRSLLSAGHDRIISFFCCLGGGASAREGKPFSERDRILPLFCSVGGGGFCSRGEAFSSHDRLLPLFCSMGGEASTHEGKQRRLLRARQNSPPLLQCGGGQRPEHNNQHQQQQESSLSREIE